MAEKQQITLAGAFALYIETQKEEDRQAVQQEIRRFTQWCDRDRAVSSLTPLDVEQYCTNLEGAGDEGAERLVITKAFLAFLHRRGWTTTALASHAKLRRTGRRKAAPAGRKQRAATSQLTSDGHKKLREELEALKAERVKRADEIRSAAATKDFSENAPLDAAREHQGQAEARIRELEQVLKNAMVMDGKAAATTSVRVAVGSRVVLRNAGTGQEVSYLLVEPTEADPAAGKLSSASPVGKAVLGCSVGEQVQVATPRGVVQYVVARVGG